MNDCYIFCVKFIGVRGYVGDIGEICMNGFEQLQEGGRFFGISGSFIGLGGGRGQGSGSVWVSRQYDLIAIFFYNFIVFWSVV